MIGTFKLFTDLYIY